MNRVTTRAEKLLEKLRSLVPGGVNSPARAFTGLGVTPLIISSGRDEKITDFDGNEYIDYNLAWGSIILGHNDPVQVSEAKDQIDKGASFGFTTEVDLPLAELIVGAFPSIDKIRFVNSGTEATMTAVRVARGYTGKKVVIKFNGNYHGHSDHFLVNAGSGVGHHYSDASSKGVTKEMVQHTYSLPYNDIKTFEEVFDKCKDDLAAVIIEPVAGNMGVVPAEQAFLNTLRERTQECGAVLIFDEVITGFRVSRLGAQEYYGITPDMTCFGKIIGSGFPLAALGGRSEIMDTLAPLGSVYQAGTLAGNTLAMRVGACVIKQLLADGFYPKLQKKVDEFITPIKEAFEKSPYPVCIQSAGSMFSIFWGKEKVTCFEDIADIDRELFNKFFQTMMEKGIYLSPSPYEASFISMAHTQTSLEYTKKEILEFLRECEEEMKDGSLKKEYATSSS